MTAELIADQVSSLSMGSVVSSVRGGHKISSGGDGGGDGGGGDDGGDYARWSWWRKFKVDARGAAAGARTR